MCVGYLNFLYFLQINGENIVKAIQTTYVYIKFEVNLVKHKTIMQWSQIQHKL